MATDSTSTGSPELLRTIQSGLDGLDIGVADDWTPAINTELCRIGRTFGLHVCASKVKKEDDNFSGEWLYDVTWIRYEEDFVTEAVLVAECEWLPGEAILEDFQKLLLARASVRLMSFQSRNRAKSKEIAEYLARQVRTFIRSSDEDRWLLAAWERNDERERGWLFRWFTIQDGAARDFPSLRPGQG